MLLMKLLDHLTSNHSNHSSSNIEVSLFAVGENQGSVFNKFLQDFY